MAEFSKFSIFSLICAVLYFLGFNFITRNLFAILSIVFGILGIRDANKNKKKGRWMAIVGLALGAAYILIVIYAILFASW